MARFIVKATPDQDLYGIYSSVVDAFVAVGSRAAVLAHLVEEGASYDYATVRLSRAERNGTSCMMGGPAYWYGWSDPYLLIMEGPGGQGELPRERLAAYLQFIEADNEEAAAALVETYDES